MVLGAVVAVMVGSATAVVSVRGGAAVKLIAWCIAYAVVVVVAGWWVATWVAGSPLGWPW